MANNRIGLICKGCGAHFIIGKTYGDEYYISNPKTFTKRMNAFYKDHHHCIDSDIKTFTECQFYLGYETPLHYEDNHMHYDRSKNIKERDNSPYAHLRNNPPRKEIT